MLERLLSPVFAREFLRESLPALFGAPEVTVADVKPGADWWVQYRLRDGGLLVAQRVPDGDLSRAASKVRRQAERRNMAGLVGERADAGVLIFPFPLDPKLKSLPEATDEATVRAAFEAAPPLERLARLEGSLRIEVMRYVPGRRCQLRYSFGDGPGDVVLGKVFADDHGAALGNIMNEVAGHFQAAAHHGFLAPRPLAWLPGLRMLAQEHAAGETLYRMIHSGRVGDGHIRAAAGVIAHLHRARFAPAGRHGIEDEIAVLERSVRRLHAAGVDPAASVSALAEIRETAGTLDPISYVPVHRDFYDKQLLFDGRRMALIDLDTFALGCAEIDVANFLAHLRLRAAQGVFDAALAERWQRAFLAAYESESERAPRPELLAFFAATTYVRLACKYKLGSEGPRLSAKLLVLAQECLREMVEC